MRRSQDKEKVYSVLKAMFEAKMEALKTSAKWLELRWFVALKHRFMQGLCSEVFEDGAGSGLAALKRRLQWRDDATEANWVKKTGAGLLLWAAAANDAAAVRALLKDGAAVGRRLRLSAPPVNIRRAVHRMCV